MTKQNKKLVQFITGLIMIALIGLLAQFLVFKQFVSELDNIPNLSLTPQISQPDVKEAPLDSDVCSMKDVVCPFEKEKKTRTVTAYNVGDPNQTDSSPCIGATGENLCEALARGEKIVATNELPLGAKVKISGEVYTVKDRTNSRYAYRYDIAFQANQHKEALQWGVKTLDIIILK
jgi:3D (Asp-Asp-Asp) domain-containing protein